MASCLPGEVNDNRLKQFTGRGGERFVLPEGHRGETSVTKGCEVDCVKSEI